MKKCPYCAEEVQDDAIKCKHCGEFLNKSMYNKDKFQKFIEFLNNIYPKYRIENKNYSDNYIIIKKDITNFNNIIFNRKKTISLTIYFDETGKPTSISNRQFQFLIDKFKKSQNDENDNKKKAEDHIFETFIKESKSIKGKETTKVEKTIFDIWKSALKTVGIIIIVIFAFIFWYISLPVYTIYLLNKKYNFLDPLKIKILEILKHPGIKK